MKKLIVLFLVLSGLVYGVSNIDYTKKAAGASITALITGVAAKNAVIRSIYFATERANQIYIYYGTVANVAAAEATYKMFECAMLAYTSISIDNLAFKAGTGESVSLWCAADPENIINIQYELLDA
jgi:hypothetical protein